MFWKKYRPRSWSKFVLNAGSRSVKNEYGSETLVASNDNTRTNSENKAGRYEPCLGSHLTIWLAGSKHAFVISETESCSWYAFSALNSQQLVQKPFVKPCQNMNRRQLAEHRSTKAFSEMNSEQLVLKHDMKVMSESEQSTTSWTSVNESFLITELSSSQLY
jgi:hypothetical protein